MIQYEVNRLNHDTARNPHPSHPHHHDAKGFVRAVEHASEERGLRLTPLRKEVLELIATAHKPVKAYDLLDQLREKHGNAAPPTVYRALDFLLENGFIHKLESINAFVSCHHPAEAHQVPFLICDTCASAQEVCDERVAELIEAQARAFGFRPQAQTLEVHGTCRHCRKD
ncbi:Fur family transcriptional regulator [Rhodanobacter thiooxydans]|uniref:Fur family transcriptional regulator n=1 Tax=Rhodanobacter thiooxydans TaxID=416169 RepID=A0A154QHM7_9GAMM|nr:transcriptional repressor [Rhodanobacter thiooxydans]EIM02044.1 Fe2+/Zn2+ uptake regulation protein [Rhodanobacter thiooxydans LCS2]KZC23183.1 Fur family transcriptional regulator [Rhodanobacter thiooxydans]MCW0201978.1 transcriptional repressor [Rhodanobacter thiooxydans]